MDPLEERIPVDKVRHSDGCTEEKKKKVLAKLFFKVTIIFTVQIM